MSQSLHLPTLAEAQQMLQTAAARNPGPWTRHSAYVAQAAQAIAQRCAALDGSAAYLLGYLHDIGRREGVSHLRHVIDGYTYLQALGYTDAARICLTHSFPSRDLQAYAGQHDCTAAQKAFLEEFLAQVEFTPYDRLIQLCDALASADGFCLIEKRLVEVALRYGLTGRELEKWGAFLQLRREFEGMIGQSVYALLPGVVENTFGLFS